MIINITSEFWDIIKAVVGRKFIALNTWHKEKWKDKYYEFKFPIKAARKSYTPKQIQGRTK